MFASEIVTGFVFIAATSTIVDLGGLGRSLGGRHGDERRNRLLIFILSSD